MGYISIFGKKVMLTSISRIAHDRQLKYILKDINCHRPTLDIGGGNGGSYKQLFPFKDTLDILPVPGNKYCMDFTKEHPNKKYKILLCLNVLEHVKDTHGFLMNSIAVMEKDSVMIGSVPFMYPIHDNDYYRFTKDGLNYILSKYFKSVHIKPYGNEVTSVLSNLSIVKYIGVPFNLTARLWDTVFRESTERNPTGYIFRCEKPIIAKTHSNIQDHKKET